jgi:hypothetical protein
MVRERNRVKEHEAFSVTKLTEEASLKAKNIAAYRALTDKADEADVAWIMMGAGRDMDDAILDTDFISKTHLIRKDDQNKMIDRIMEMQGYQFFCHEQIKIELKRHNIGNSPAWMEARIIDGSVHCMSDEEILDELYSIYSNSAVAMYVSMLRNGCEAYKKGYFEENFTRLQALDYLSISKASFLQKLKEDCDDIGEGKNLGELKSYVLLQLLSVKPGEQIYVFCSDDKNARSGIISLGSARCISVLSAAFMRLDKEGILGRKDAEP